MCAKIRNPGIVAVLHWLPRNLHIFDSNPSLNKIAWYAMYTCHIVYVKLLSIVKVGTRTVYTENTAQDVNSVSLSKW